MPRIRWKYQDCCRSRRTLPTHPPALFRWARHRWRSALWYAGDGTISMPRMPRNQAAGLPFERAVYGTADQSGVVFGAVADVRFDTWIPVERPHQCGREFQPDTECFGDRAAEQPGQRRFDFKTLMSGGRVEGGDHLACRNRHGGHVIARIVHPLPPYAAVRAAGRAAAHAAAGTAATAEFHSYAHYRGRVRTNSNATEKIRELSGPRKALPIKRLRPAGTMRDRKPGRTALSVPRIVPAGRSRN